MAASFRVRTGEMEIAAPVSMFPYPPLAVTSSAFQYDISTLANRFVFLPAGAWSSGPPIRMIVNWEGLLKR